MKLLQGLLVLILLLTSRKYREQWRQSADRLAEANDFAAASLRRMDALHNAGKPRLRLLK